MENEPESSVMSDIEQAKKDFMPPPGWKRNPILLKLKKFDEYLSYRLALAYDDNSRFAQYRPKLLMFEKSAHAIVCFGVALLFWWTSIRIEPRAVYTNVILGMAIDVFVVAVMKSLARRRRPGVTKAQYEADPSSKNLSFPSGFVSRATLLYMIFSNEGFSTFFQGVFFVWAMLMTVTKVFLGRFFIGDALAGIPIGCMVYKFLDLIWLDPNDLIDMEAFFGGQLGDP